MVIPIMSIFMVIHIMSIFMVIHIMSIFMVSIPLRLCSLYNILLSHRLLFNDKPG